MAPLTYARLLARLDSHFKSIPEQFPSQEDAQRVRDVQRAIKAGLISAQAGLDGDRSVLSPGQLKHWVSSKIADIHQQLDREAAVSPSTSLVEVVVNGDMGVAAQYHQITAPHETNYSREDSTRGAGHPATRPAATQKISAVIKRPIYGTTTNAGVKKTTTKRTSRAKTRIAPPTNHAAIVASEREQEAAAALLGLFSSSSPTDPRTSFSTETSSLNLCESFTSTSTAGYGTADRMRSQHIVQPPPVYTQSIHTSHNQHSHPPARSTGAFLALPPSASSPTASATEKEIFLAGVQFAMQNFESAHLPGCCGDDDDFPVQCYEHVRMQLGIADEDEREHVGLVTPVESACTNNSVRAVGRGFWDVI